MQAVPTSLGTTKLGTLHAEKKFDSKPYTLFTFLSNRLRTWHVVHPNTHLEGHMHTFQAVDRRSSILLLALAGMCPLGTLHLMDTFCIPHQ